MSSPANLTVNKSEISQDDGAETITMTEPAVF